MWYQELEDSLKRKKVSIENQRIGWDVKNCSIKNQKTAFVKKGSLNMEKLWLNENQKTGFGKKCGSSENQKTA